MEESPGVDERLLSLLVVAATAITIVYNGLAATGHVNGVTPAEISARYPTVLTPAGWSFSIWILIYLGLIAFSIFQLRTWTRGGRRSVRIIFVASCILNCGWIYFWHHSQIGICLGLISALLISLLVILWQLRDAGTSKETLFAKAPFGLYAGWVTAATLVNLNVFLAAYDPSITAESWKIFGTVCILVAAVAAVAVRFGLHNFLYSLAVAWAATAIAVHQSGNTAIIVTSAICVIICLIMSVSFVMDQKSVRA
jgi:translocator protein